MNTLIITIYYLLVSSLENITSLPLLSYMQDNKIKL